MLSFTSDLQIYPSYFNSRTTGVLEKTYISAWHSIVLQGIPYTFIKFKWIFDWFNFTTT